jgi:hypothetical protein
MGWDDEYDFEDGLCDDFDDHSEIRPREYFQLAERADWLGETEDYVRGYDDGFDAAEGGPPVEDIDFDPREFE